MRASERSTTGDGRQALKKLFHRSSVLHLRQ
jgi:hypothetical protein